MYASLRAAGVVVKITDVECVHAKVSRKLADEELREKYPYPPKYFTLDMVRVSTEDGVVGYGYGWVDPWVVDLDWGCAWRGPWSNAYTRGGTWR